jgi:hypothetical protein
MNRQKRTILSISGVVLGLMILFPPYWVMYEQPGDNLHTGVGHHPIWSPPTPAFAFETLHGYAYGDSIVGDSEEARLRVAESRLAASITGFNTVGFVFNTVILIILTGGALLLFGRRRKRGDAA